MPIKKPDAYECEQCTFPIHLVVIVDGYFLCEECAKVKTRMLAVLDFDSEDQ